MKGSFSQLATLFKEMEDTSRYYEMISPFPHNLWRSHEYLILHQSDGSRAHKMVYRTPSIMLTIELKIVIIS
jgi:hypothetical protein